MKKRILPIGVLVLTGLFFLVSCDKEGDRERSRKKIQQAFQERIAEYKEDHARKCRREVMEVAKYLADSTMLARARNIKVVDSLARPPKPNKPVPPPTKTLEDTLEVAPLLPIDSSDFSPEN